MKTVQEMIEADIKREYETYDEAMKKKDERYEELKKETGLQMPSTLHDSKMNEIREEYKYYFQLKYLYGDKGAKERIVKDIEKHYQLLQNKVEAKIGKILTLKYLGGWDYRFHGELGDCVVEVIIAGGYAKQRRHTRWIIKKDYR